MFKNALITNHEGNLLSSEFYDPYTDKFTFRNKEQLNKEILSKNVISEDNNKYGVNLLLDFCRIDSNQYLNSLINLKLINPALENDINYKLPQMPDYFKNLYARRLSKFFVKGDKSLNKFSLIPIKNIKLEHEVLFNVYLSLVDFKYIIVKEGAKPQRESVPNLYILDKLGTLNMRFIPETGMVDPSSKREYKDILKILNKLFKSDEEINKFLCSDESGKQLSQSTYSIKQWLLDVYNKIVDYEDSSSNPDEISSLLLKAKDLLELIQPPSLENDKITFLSSELENAKRIFNVISYVFGHFTLRLIFLHMIQSYGEVGGFKIDVMTIPYLKNIAKSLENFDIRSSTQLLGKKNTPLTDTKSINNHIFSLLFLDSFLYLPVLKSIPNSESNAVYLGYSPLSFISDSIDSRNRRNFNREIENDFFLRHQQLYSNYFMRRGTNDVKVDLFIKSAEEMLTKVIDKLRKEIFDSNRFEDKKPKEKEAIFTQLVISASEDIFSKGYRIGSAGGEDTKYNLRFQIERLLMGHNDQGNLFERIIIFHKVKIDDKIFKMQMDKDDFLGANIRIWRATPKDFDLSSYQQIINKQGIDLKVKILREIIKQNGNKVKIFTGLNINNEFGVQYILPAQEGDQFSYLPRTYTDDISPSYFEIDFDTNPNFAESQLRFIASLLTKMSGSINNFFFVMKPFSSTVDSQEMICAFDFRKLFKIDEIHSPKTYVLSSESSKKYNYEYKRIVLSSDVGSFDFSKVNNLWKVYAYFLPVIARQNFLDIYDLVGTFNDIEQYFKSK